MNKAANKFGQRPLHAACGKSKTNSRAKIVRLLLEYGADIQATTIWGETPLQLAKEKGYIQLVQLLEAAARKVHISATYIMFTYRTATYMTHSITHHTIFPPHVTTHMHSHIHSCSTFGISVQQICEWQYASLPRADSHSPFGTERLAHMHVHVYANVCMCVRVCACVYVSVFVCACFF